jgi:hypothetical protein
MLIHLNKQVRRCQIERCTGLMWNPVPGKINETVLGLEGQSWKVIRLDGSKRLPKFAETTKEESVCNSDEKFEGKTNETTMLPTALSSAQKSISDARQAVVECLCGVDSGLVVDLDGADFLQVVEKFIHRFKLSEYRVKVLFTNLEDLEDDVKDLSARNKILQARLDASNARFKNALERIELLETRETHNMEQTMKRLERWMKH